MWCTAIAVPKSATLVSVYVKATIALEVGVKATARREAVTGRLSRAEVTAGGGEASISTSI